MRRGALHVLGMLLLPTAESTTGIVLKFLGG
jgi:hypothetical protein